MEGRKAVKKLSTRSTVIGQELHLKKDPRSSSTISTTTMMPKPTKMPLTSVASKKNTSKITKTNTTKRPNLADIGNRMTTSTRVTRSSVATTSTTTTREPITKKTTTAKVTCPPKATSTKIPPTTKQSRICRKCNGIVADPQTTTAASRTSTTTTITTTSNKRKTTITGRTKTIKTTATNRTTRHGESYKSKLRVTAARAAAEKTKQQGVAKSNMLTGVPDVVVDVVKAEQNISLQVRHPTSTTTVVISTTQSTDPPDIKGVSISQGEEEQQLMEESFSKPEGFVDPDAVGTDDPQLCTDYVKEIYINWLKMERKEVYTIQPNFMSHQKIGTHHRAVLVDWLVQVQRRFSLLPDTIYVCFDILDRYLQVVQVPKQDLQLVGITSLFIASKYEEIYPPTISEFAYIAADLYTSDQIRKREVDMLRKLDYQLGKPNPLTILRRLSKVMPTDSQTHNLAKYIIELSYLDAGCSSMLPSKKAAGALMQANLILHPWRTAEQIWTPSMSYLSQMMPSDITEDARKLRIKLRKGHTSTKYTAIREKFETTNLKVAKSFVLSQLEAKS